MHNRIIEVLGGCRVYSHPYETPRRDYAKMVRAQAMHKRFVLTKFTIVKVGEGRGHTLMDRKIHSLKMRLIESFG